MVQTRDSIIREIQLRLAAQIVDVELDPEHINLGINKALEKYRQRSENAVKEAFISLTLEADISDYTLPDEVIEVKQILRRSVGTAGGDMTNFEPFEAQYLNTYMLNSGRAGGLAVYDALAQHRELLARMFGGYITFTWSRTTKNLFIHRKMRADDDVFLHVFMYRIEEELFNDVYSSPWIKDYALCMCKLILAEGRGKFSQIAGPQGGSTLNADALRADAQTEIEKLESEFMRFTEGSGGYGFLIG